MKIPLMKPYITAEIKKRVSDVLDSGYLTEGSVTHEFEQAFKDYLGSKYAIASTSCTTGLELALKALNIGRGDEVIVPDYTYPATALVVALVGAHCVIVDIDPDTLLIDYDSLEAAISPKTKAVMPVSLFGNPLDYSRLDQIKKRHGIYIVEDAACSIGAEYKNRKVGMHADITVFSLHPRKFITTGEGGMITTENAEWADWMNSYKHFGIGLNNSMREGVQFEMVGTNYKLSNIQAAIGLGQFKEIDILLKRRRELAIRYTSLLNSVNGIKFPEINPDGCHSWQSFCILTPSRDKIMGVLRPEGIEVQIGTYSLHMHKAFNDKNLFTLVGNMSGSISAYNQCLALPLYHELSEVEQDYIAKRIKQLI